MRFYLGTHEVPWLGRLDVPLFVSHRRLVKRKRLPRARAGWALDSGGFSELSMYGEWRTSEDEYVAAVRRYQDEVGQLDWAAPMDWMCEPHMLAKTGLTVADHQRRTVENYVRLRTEIPVIPVLQGWSPSDYEQCVLLYESYGVDLTVVPEVGLGTVCRRQDTTQLGAVLFDLHDHGLRLHGFGVKTIGLANYGDCFASADSMAWSYDARRADPMPGHTHQNCANCPDYALRWRQAMLERVDAAVRRPLQGAMV